MFYYNIYSSKYSTIIYSTIYTIVMLYTVPYNILD